MAPRAEGGEAVWWIIDYKTSHDGGADLSDEVARDRFLAEHREKFRGQLEAYAQVLKELYAPQTEVRAGIYYPRLLLFDSWTV
jgi:ATP-dependent exoDNAse (exonuclease V) beta subunit